MISIILPSIHCKKEKQQQQSLSSYPACSLSLCITRQKSQWHPSTPTSQRTHPLQAKSMANSSSNSISINSSSSQSKHHDELQLTKAAAWAWYLHSSGSGSGSGTATSCSNSSSSPAQYQYESRHSRKHSRRRPFLPSRFQLQHISSSASSSSSSSSLLDSYEMVAVRKQLDGLQLPILPCKTSDRSSLRPTNSLNSQPQPPRRSGMWLVKAHRSSNSSFCGKDSVVEPIALKALNSSPAKLRSTQSRPPPPPSTDAHASAPVTAARFRFRRHH